MSTEDELKDRINKQLKNGFIFKKTIVCDWDGWIEKKYNKFKQWLSERREKK